MVCVLFLVLPGVSLHRGVSPCLLLVLLLPLKLAGISLAPVPAKDTRAGASGEDPAVEDSCIGGVGYTGSQPGSSD